MAWYVVELSLMIVLTLATLVSIINLLSLDPLQNEYWNWVYALVGCGIFAILLGSIF